MASGSGSSFMQCDAPQSTSEKLNELRMRTDIKDTQSLVKAYNDETDPIKRKEMFKWLEAYVEWISQQSDVTLKPEIVRAYSSLATVRCEGPKENELLKKYFSTLTERLEGRSKYCTPEIIVCLEQTLSVIDPKFVESNASLMLDLPPLLLCFLDPAKKPYTRKTYIEHGVALFALHQTLVVLKTVARIELAEDLIQKCIATMKKIEKRATYYPYVYFASLLEHGVKMLNDQGSIGAWMVVGRGFFYAMCGSLYMLQSATAAMQLQVDFTAVESGVGYFKKAWDTIDQNKWSSRLQNVLHAAEKSLEENKFEHFKVSLQAVYEKRKSIFRNRKEKLLRFSVIFQLGMLAIKGGSSDFRREALNELIVIVGPSRDVDEWLHDGDLFEAMLDALYGIHLKENDSGDAAEIIRHLASIAKEWKVADKIDSWKGSCKSVDDMLQPSSLQRTLSKSESDTLFEQLRKGMGLSSISEHLRDIDSLKNKYTSLEFTKVVSFIEECNVMHVEDLEFHIMGYKDVPIERKGPKDTLSDADHFHQLAHAKRREVNRIDLKDMFRRELSAGYSWSSKDKNYLLIGNAGTGKTSITKHFAHEWASGHMGQQFKMLFLLRIRNLTDYRYDNCGPMRKKSLAVAIANECFDESEPSSESYDELRKRVEIALDHSSTLLILDGVDEGDVTGTELVQKALERKCVVLLTSRPYNLHGIKGDVGNELECLGLDDEQLVRYINRQMESEASDLVRHLQSTPSVWQVTHVPITAGIVCALWKEQLQTSSTEPAIDKCRFHLYDAISNFIWERFRRKHESSSTLFPDRDKVFEALEKIAFLARERGEIEIRQSLVRGHAPDGTIGGVLRASGFLLFQMEGTVYQFAHLSFHEFFSGRRLAHCLFHGSEREKKSAISFISENKYKEVHWETLSFMTQRVVDDNGEEAIDEILAVIDQEPHDIIGVQHIFLKLRIFDAYLSMMNTTENVNYPPCCDNVVGAASRLIVELWNSRKEVDLLTRHVEQLPNVMENLPKPMLEGFLEGWSIDYSTSWKKKSLERLARFARICPALVQPFKEAFRNEEASFKSGSDDRGYSDCLEEFARPLSEVPEFVIEYLNDWCHTCSADEVGWPFEYVSKILRKRPRNAHILWKMLIGRCLDDDSKIRESALLYIGAVAEAGVDLAKHVWEQMTQSIVKNDGQTTLLEEACNHDDDGTRLRAIELRLECCIALHHSPQIIEEAFLTGMSDSEDDVRRAVIQFLKSLAHLGNAYASIVENILKMCFEDSHWLVRYSAVKHAIDICNALNNRDLAVELLVKSCLYDSDRDVCIRAVESVVKLITKEEDSEILMNALERCCSDEDSYVRRKVCRRIVDVAVRVPSLAPAVVKMLKSRWNDESKRVRYRVVDSLCDLCLNLNLVDELSDVLSAESVDTEESVNERIRVLKDQLMVFGDETDVEFFRFLLQRYIRTEYMHVRLLRDKIERMALAIEQSDLLILEVVRESVHSIQKHDDGFGWYSGSEDAYYFFMGVNMEAIAKLLKILVRNIEDSSKTPAYASELMTHVLYLHYEWTHRSSTCSKIIDTVPIDYIFEYLLSVRDGSSDGDFKMRFLGTAVTVVDTCDSQSNGLYVYESHKATFIRKSPQDIDYLVQLLKSMYPTLQPSEHQHRSSKRPCRHSEANSEAMDWESS